MMAAGRSAARAARAPLRAGRALVPWRFSRLVRLLFVDWLSGDPAGEQTAGSLRVVVDHEPGRSPAPS
jgi:hypothetical protein